MKLPAAFSAFVPFAVLASLTVAASLHAAGNPIITDAFTADPAVIVHKDRVYLYVGQDEAPNDRHQGYIFFYHNGGRQVPEIGGSFRRSVCVDELFYNPDGTIRRIVQTTEGVAPVR